MKSHKNMTQLEVSQRCAT